jgi:hypothetical protein
LPVRWTLEDTSGFFAAMLIIVVPLWGITWFGESMTKDPIGLRAYIVPTIISFAAAIVVTVVGCQVPRHSKNSAYLDCAFLALVVIALSFCLLPEFASKVFG